MGAKKPVRRVPAPAGQAPATLMGNQDTGRKGDGTGHLKQRQMTFWVTDEQRERIRSYAREHDMSVSRLIVEGLEMRMKLE